MKPEISDVVKSTGKPVFCSHILCPDLGRSFANAEQGLPYGEKGKLREKLLHDPNTYIGYANFDGPIAVVQGKTENQATLSRRKYDAFVELLILKAALLRNKILLMIAVKTIGAIEMVILKPLTIL